MSGLSVLGSGKPGNRRELLFLQCVFIEPLSSKLRIGECEGTPFYLHDGSEGKIHAFGREQIYALPGQLMLCPEPGKVDVAQGKALGLMSLSD